MVRTLSTDRLTLRPWVDADVEPYCELCADPAVMEHLPAGERATFAAQTERIRAHLDRDGFGLWAVEVADAPFIGFIGVQRVPFDAHFTPAVEIGWRLARAHWQKGYATEGARAALAFGFGDVGLDEIVAMTVPANRRSWSVMERLGMARDPADDFDHPRLAEDSPLRRHVLYRLKKAAWARGPDARASGTS